MNTKTIGKTTLVLLAVAALLGLNSCGSDINEEGSPVELIASFDQAILVYDYAPETGCTVGVGTLSIRSVIKTLNSDTRFLGVKLSTVRITYKRTDGGTVVPPAYVQALSGTIDPGSSGDVTGFLLYDANALRQAPFVALLPENGGRDPETGKPIIIIETKIEVFGETLSGEKVSAETRFPLSFCFGCGCSIVN
ncbi:MAG: hypothetical protein HYU52_03930 [Acidobacteria bacterium]|nr:hypothetical protein [Acidobacteriota bacterium]